MEVLTRRSVLVWAREQAGFSTEEAASLLDVPTPTLEAWESEDSTRTWGDVQKIADQYQVPVAILFLESPPESPSLDRPVDLRLKPDFVNTPKNKRALRKAINQVRSWKSTFSRLDVKHEVSVPTTSLGVDPDQVGFQLRAHLGIEDRDQLNWATTENALYAWRAAVESTGPLVFALSHLSRDVCRGFALWDDGNPPVIALSSEAEQARIFTLLHEYTHLMLRSAAVCDQFETSQSGRSTAEAFCNRVAAGALMPRHLVTQLLPEFREQISSTPSRDSLRPMAQALSVSIPALALRLEEMGVVEDGTFEAASLLSYEGREVWRRKGGGGQNTHPSPTIAERGTSFSDAVYGAWVAKEISLGEAAHAMGIRPDYVPLIRDKIESRHDRLG